MALDSWVLGPKLLVRSTVKERVTKLNCHLEQKQEALNAAVRTSTMSLNAAESFICLELNNTDKLNSRHKI